MLLETAIVALTGLWRLSVYAIPSQPVDVKSLLSQKSNNWAQGTVISFPNSATFENSTTRWSTFDEPTYHAAISPANEADVAKSVRDQKLEYEKENKTHILTSCQVKLASSYNIPFLATGGRHGYTTTLGNLQGGLAIDLGQFKSYSIDSVAGTLTVGGATTLHDFQDALFEAGYMIRMLPR